MRMRHRLKMGVPLNVAIGAFVYGTGRRPLMALSFPLWEEERE